MEIQSVTAEHLLACAELFHAVFAAAPWHEIWELATVTKRLEEIYTTPGFYGLAAYRESVLMGFALGYVETWHQGPVYYLKEMCVQTASQRTGVGTALLHALESALLTRQIARIYLLTARGELAEAFYRNQGFYVSDKMIMMGKRL
ncbi:MAG: GNAT family N-acetyltransferase [Caldilineaceae bacterium]